MSNKKVKTQANGFAQQIATSLDDSTIWNYNGAKYSLDMNDADDVERYYACAESMDKRQEEAKKEEEKAEDEGAPIGHAAGIRLFCARVRLFFDDLFGEGAGLAVIGPKDNTNNAIKACASLYAHVMGQGDATANTAQAITDNTEEFLTRQQRRKAEREKTRQEQKATRK